MASSKSPLLLRATDKVTPFSRPDSSHNLLTHRLLRVFQYDLVTTEYRGYDNQELQAGEVPTNARAKMESISQESLHLSSTVRTEDHTRMD